MKLINVMEDGQQVEILGQVDSMEEGLKKLGITKEEYRKFVHYQEDRAFHEQIVDMFKAEQGMKGHVAEEKTQAEFFGRWHKLHNEAVDTALEEAREARWEVDPAAGTNLDMLTRYAAERREFRYEDVWRAITDA